MSVQQQMVDAAEQSGFEAGRQAGRQEERDAIVAWLRRLMTANRDPKAREELDRVLSMANSTLGSVRKSLERGDHLKT